MVLLAMSFLFLRLMFVFDMAVFVLGGSCTVAGCVEVLLVTCLGRVMLLCCLVRRQREGSLGVGVI